VVSTFNKSVLSSITICQTTVKITSIGKFAFWYLTRNKHWKTQLFCFISKHWSGRSIWS
jgi:hypothetical protein